MITCPYPLKGEVAWLHSLQRAGAKFGYNGSMRPAEILALYDQDQRRELRLADMTREVTPQVVRYVRPAPGMSFILYSRLNAQNADAVIASEQDYFARAGLRMEWKCFEHDTPPDLGARLLAHGFSADEPGAIMALELDELPASLQLPAGLEVRRLERPEELEDVIAVLRAVWGGSFDWMRARLGGHMRIPGYISVYLATVDQRPVSAAWVYFYPGSHFAGLWGGSTLPEYRKQGLYSALLALRAQEARQRGYRFAVVEASAMSQPILARHGFVGLTRAVSYNWEAVQSASMTGTRAE